MILGRSLSALMLLSCLACSATATPTPTPGGFSDLVAALVLRGVTVTNHVSGDAGCSDPTLHGNAVRLDMTLTGDSTVYTAYIFRWRRPPDFAAAAETFAACVDEFVGQQPAARIEGLEHEPWRAFGPDWSDQITDKVSDALRAVSSQAARIIP